MDIVYFFGYGSNRSKKKITELLGYTPKKFYGAIAVKYDLGYHILGDVKNHDVKKILQTVWGDDFASYSIRPGSGIVAGIVWEITKEDLDKIKKWEFVGSWREIIEISVYTYKGQKLSALTDVVPDSIPFYGVADGLFYKDVINLDKKVTSSDDDEIQKIDTLRSLLESYQD